MHACARALERQKKMSPTHRRAHAHTHQEKAKKRPYSGSSPGQPPPAACMASGRQRMSPGRDAPSRTAHPKRPHWGRSTANASTHQAADCAVRPPLHQPVTGTLRWRGGLTTPVLAQGSGSRVAFLSRARSSRPFLFSSGTHPLGTQEKPPAEPWGDRLCREA